MALQKTITVKELREKNETSKAEAEKTKSAQQQGGR